MAAAIVILCALQATQDIARGPVVLIDGRSAVVPSRNCR
jgi:hypothetical protein